MNIQDELRLLSEGYTALNETLQLDKKRDIKIIYFGVTEDEIKKGFIEYNSPHYTHKGVNTSLDGLKQFITDHHLQEYVKSYAIIPINKFLVDETVYPNKKYDMISVKLPFKIQISNIYKL